MVTDRPESLFLQASIILLSDRICTLISVLTRKKDDTMYLIYTVNNLETLIYTHFRNNVIDNINNIMSNYIIIILSRRRKIIDKLI